MRIFQTFSNRGFTEYLPIPGFEENNGDLVNLLSTELDQVSFSLQYPSANQVKLNFEFTAAAEGDLVEFSNSAHPELKDKVQILNQAKFCVYAQIPAHETVGHGIGILCSMFPNEYLDPGTITGMFLNTVISGEHDSAFAYSENRKFRFVSGILPSGEKRRIFLDFLQNNGTQFDDKTFLVRNPDNTEIYARINGNLVNILFWKNDGQKVDINTVFTSVSPVNIPLAEREFLKGVLPTQGNKTVLTGSMKNGKFHLDFSVTAEQLRALK